MELAIHTYGHIDAMFYTLNAIAMLMNHKFGEAIMLVIAMSSVGYYALKMSYAGSNGYKIHLGKVVGMVAMIYFLLLPRVDMLVHDHVSKKKEKVDNLPLGFSLPVGMFEGFGNILTGGFEQAFTAVGNTNYRDYGMVFGARLVQESRNWRIRNPEFMENMSNFIDRCVMTEAMIGQNYTPEELLTTDDIWGLIKKNLPTLRRATMRINKDRVMMDCKKAAKEVIEPAFRLEIESLEKKSKGTDIGEAGEASYVQRTFERLNTNFKKNVELSFKSYVGSNAGAEALIRQQMLMNSIKNWSDDYGYARASATQESNWRIAGDLASTYIPILMSVLKCLVYSSFIFMFPMLMMSGGWSRYLGYLTLVASFQLWAPLNSVLNMFIDIYSSNTLKGIADNIVSFSTMSQIGNYTDKIVAVASGLQIAIPFLAFSIIQGGVGGFIHLAGTITGASQGAASQAANESVTGNKSFDNYSVGNQQLYNQNGFKTDWNESYASGASSTQHMDGTMERVTGNGNTLMQSGVGFTASGGATAYKQEDSRQAQVSEGIQQQEALISSDQRSLSEADRSTFAKTVDRVSNIAQRDHAGEKFDYDKMGEQGKSMENTVNIAKTLHEDHGYGWNQATEAALRGNVSASTPGKFLGIGASISADGSITASNLINQSSGEQESFEKGSAARENYNNVVKASSNTSWAKETSIDKTQSEGVRSSHEKQIAIEQQLSKRQESLANWHQAKTIVDSQGASSSRDMYQEVVDGVKQEYGVDAKTAQKMADRRSPEAQKVWTQLQNSDQYVANLVDNISSGKSSVSGDSAAQQMAGFTHDNQDKVNRDPAGQIKQSTDDDSFNPETIRNNITKTEAGLKEGFDKMNTENATQHTNTKKNNEIEASRVQYNVDSYEKDRIGRGEIAQKAAKALHLVGEIGDGLGAPDKDTKSRIIDKGVYEKAKN